MLARTHPSQVERRCPICARLYFVRLKYVKRGEGQYCSPSCFHKARNRPEAERFWEKVKETASCWLWTGANKPGRWPYGMLAGPGKTAKLAHRVSWELHHGAIPTGLNVLHKCDNPSCVRPDHLFLGTLADNTADMIAKGRGKGGRPIGTKLSPASL